MSRRLSPCHALACAVLCTLAAASPATAATQTVADPTDGYADDIGQSTDFRTVTLDTTSTARQAAARAPSSSSPPRSDARGVVYLDTDADNKADYADRDPPRPEPPSEPRRRPTATSPTTCARSTTSTTDCQSYDDGGTAARPLQATPPGAGDAAPAGDRARPSRSRSTSPRIGSPASLRWAIVGVSSSTAGRASTTSSPTRPTACRTLDPHNPPPGERDDVVLLAGRRRPERRLPRRHEPTPLRFGAAGAPVDQPPTVSLAAGHGARRGPGQPVGLSRGRERPRRHDRRATRGTSTTTTSSTTPIGQTIDAHVPDRRHATASASRVIDNGGNVGLRVPHDRGRAARRSR